MLGMVPRGTSKPAGTTDWRRGAAQLALASGAPLVPVRRLNPRRFAPRRPVEVRIGQPIAVERHPPTVAAARELTARAESAVNEL
jgi:1-acyl-sn-glycerol-3-phosphate acyltransferase